MVARYYPQHDDISLLAAEAAMDTLPWDYWEPDKQTAKPRLGEAIRLVETVLARNAEHPQAPHLYIHLMENGPDPKRAEAAADRLSAPLARRRRAHGPYAGPYLLPARAAGRIRSASTSTPPARTRPISRSRTTRASSATAIIRTTSISSSRPRRWAATCRPRSARRSGWRASSMPNTATQLAWIQAIYAAPYFATLQFAPASEVLELPEPDPRLAYVQGVRHYVRAVAYAQQKNEIGFDKEMRELNRVRQSDALKPMVDQGMPAARPAGARRACRARQICLDPRAPSPGGRPFPRGRSRSRTASPTWSRPGGISRSTSR